MKIKILILSTVIFSVIGNNLAGAALSQLPRTVVKTEPSEGCGPKEPPTER
jgi:hypothetical protein